MIKVGQIYSTGLLKWVVTHISDYPKYWATLIKNDGVVAGMYYEKDEDVKRICLDNLWVEVNENFDPKSTQLTNISFSCFLYRSCNFCFIVPVDFV